MNKDRVSGLDTPALREGNGEFEAQPENKIENHKPSRLEITLEIEESLKAALETLEKEDKAISDQIKVLEDRIQRMKSQADAR